MPNEIPLISGPGKFQIEVVGEAHYQDAFVRHCGPRCAGGFKLEVRAHLRLEDDNKFDSNAVGILLGHAKVGHLPKATARDFRRAIIAGDLSEYMTFECAAIVRGGWDNGNGDVGHFGIWLDLPEN